jgi:hypothetical protein
MTIGAHSNERGRAADRVERSIDAVQTAGNDADPKVMDDAEGTHAAKELWVALLLQNLQPHVVQLNTRETNTAAAESRTRSSDGKLTFSTAIIDGPAVDGALGVGAGAEGTHTSAAIGQLHLEIDGGRLGTVYLTVQRQGNAVSVVVGVADPVQRALVELELGSLTQALRAAGLNVGSVRVLHPDVAGTALAQGKRSMTLQTAESASLAYRNYRTRQHPDPEEGLDVVG